MLSLGVNLELLISSKQQKNSYITANPKENPSDLFFLRNRLYQIEIVDSPNFCNF